MTTRRTFVSSATLLASVTASLTAAAQTAAQDAKQADYLFVQTANAMSFDKATNKLTLHGVSPVTVFFSDRPERIAGNMKTSAFVPFWSQGKDSFLSDPPNADISVVEGKELRQIVAVLKSPELNGGDLSYTVKILQGEMPAKAEEVSVFIDVIGMPMTPVSYAGVARRSYRRAVIR
jgi:non-ribosomal peptide synthetase component E (peptide arylation enzyme)